MHILYTAASRDSWKSSGGNSFLFLRTRKKSVVDRKHCNIAKTFESNPSLSLNLKRHEKGAKKYNEISTIALLCSLWLILLRGVKLNYFFIIKVNSP